MTRTILATIFIGLATPVFAQSASNYGRPLDTPENRADAAMRGAARCVYGEVPATVRRILESDIGSDEEARQVRALRGVARVCFQQQWPDFPATTFREAIAEVVYRDQYTMSDPGIDPATPPTSFAVVRDGQKGTPAQEVAWTLAALGRCVVYAGAQPARHWVIGPRNVEEEERRFAALRPAMTRCGAPANVITVRNFRGPVAQALLDRARRGRKG